LLYLPFRKRKAALEKGGLSGVQAEKERPRG
jgi:hypothetical protein